MHKAQQENSDREDPVDVWMKVVDPKTRKVLFDSGNSFPSTNVIVRSFLRQHCKDLSTESSGYAGDISDDASSVKETVGTVKPRWTFASAVSTISGGNPPASIPSVREDRISSTSSSPAKGNKRPNKNVEPILTSSIKMNDSIANDSVKLGSESASSKSSLSNGELMAEVGIGLSDTSLSTPPDLKKSPKVEDINGGLVATPRGRKRPRKNSKSIESSDDKLSSADINQAKRQKKGTEIFDSSSNEESMTADDSTSPDRQNDAVVVKAAPEKAQFLESPACGSRVIDETEISKLARSQTLWGTIAIGEWVFARWRDKNYYSGKITQKGLNDTWHIHFEDNMDDVASETHILPIKIIGEKVKAVYSPDNIYRPSLATVIGQIIIDKDRAEYAIRCDDLTQVLVCQRKQLSIKESEAKELRKHLQASAPKAADLSLDNILAGPRRRGAGATPQTPQPTSRKVVGGAFDASSADDSVLRDSGAGTPAPALPPAVPVAPAPKKPATLNKSTPSSKSSSTTSADSDVHSATTIIITPQSNRSTITTPSAVKTPSVVKDPPNKETPKGVSKESAKKSSKSKDKGLFDGFQFFLTASGGGDPSSSGTDVPVSLPYDKDEYKDSIETRGGKVVESVGREKGRENVFLISDSHARTVKYIYCLAAGIPCVSHQWIVKCLGSNSIVPWKEYELKSGYSLEAEQVIPAHQKKPLKNIKIFVTAETDELYNYWKPVLTAAEATLLKPKKKGSVTGIVPGETEVVVTDSSCSQEVYDKVTANNIPMVKPEWLVQTIITGKKASYSGHERYKIIPGNEYGEEDE
ncbi:unnamed protein product [Allacma fusca]|uniref:BRCT domain-containing protein n=1 Tax=Allacma fusca TaxID=39272 RepID=A0A8J2J8S1_9HEXA|nr:unnamed protein product [Allacma fusca]